MSAGQWFQEVLAGQCMPRPQEHAQGWGQAFAASQNSYQYFFNPCEILSLHGSPSTCLGRNHWSPKPWQKEPSPPQQSSQAGFIVCWGICSVSKSAHSLYDIVYF